MANRKFRRGQTVRVSEIAYWTGVAERYIGRKGVVTELCGKDEYGNFLYGLKIHDRVSTLEVVEDCLNKV
jgi:hypothetical protein